MKLLQRMIALVTSGADPPKTMVLHYNLALGLLGLERFHEAKRSMHRTWHMARQSGEMRLLAPIQMALALIAIHDGQPANAVEYAELAQANLRDLQSDETILVKYYLSVAYLANNQLDLARKEWSAREELVLNLENKLEMQWLCRALERAEHPDYPAELDPEVCAAAAEFRAVLAGLIQQAGPAPGAAAAD